MRTNNSDHREFGCSMRAASSLHNIWDSDFHVQAQGSLLITLHILQLVNLLATSFSKIDRFNSFMDLISNLVVS